VIKEGTSLEETYDNIFHCLNISLESLESIRNNKALSPYSDNTVILSAESLLDESVAQSRPASLRVLLVDDNIICLKFFSRTLIDLGYSVTVASNGEEVLMCSLSIKSRETNINAII
jgi:PleD family two-component response regulator